MPRIDIKTTLGFCPRKRAHEIIYITRGATASFNFPLFDKVYTFNDIEQMTFTFSQGKKIWWFNLIEYYIPSEDTEVDDTKNYYENPRIPNKMNGECEIDLVENPTGNPKEKGYYEKAAAPITNPLDTTEEYYWKHNEHFSYPENYDNINFMLFPENTKAFEKTVPDDNMGFEIAIKLNTNGTDKAEWGLARDSVLVEPQHPVAVLDSIYSKISDDSFEGTGYSYQKAIPSTVTLSSNRLLCDKYR